MPLLQGKGPAKGPTRLLLGHRTLFCSHPERPEEVRCQDRSDKKQEGCRIRSPGSGPRGPLACSVILGQPRGLWSHFSHSSNVNHSSRPACDLGQVGTAPLASVSLCVRSGEARSCSQTPRAFANGDLWEDEGGGQAPGVSWAQSQVRELLSASTAPGCHTEVE